MWLSLFGKAGVFTCDANQEGGCDLTMVLRNLGLQVTARPPAAEDRRRATDVFNACASQLAGVALIVDATGFSGALLRSALTMVFMMARKGFPARIFESIQDAAGWLGPLVAMEPSAIVAIARDARKRLHQPAAAG